MGFGLLLGGPATADDIVAMARRFHAETGYPMDRVQEDALRTLLVDASLGRAWLATYRGDRVGYAIALYRHSIDHGGRVALVDDLYLLEGARGRGLGRRFLRAICRDLADFGIRQVHLFADAGGSAAMLYESEGFEPSPLVLFERDLREEDDDDVP
ncbi:GNAT family N-acetyltransferase [Polymorphum gilvum]|nr:GNAT family N-acetyltransferase [Polymorphum gilvum]